LKRGDLHPELRRTYGLVPAVPFHNPLFHFIVRLLQRLRSRRIKPVAGVVIEDRPLSHGAVRIYRPQSAANGAGLLWIHGGGYIIGDVSISDRECIALAKELGLVVVSVDYRLAPEHPFPAALDDCFEAWHFVQDRADELGIDRRRIALVGQSAGGGLAAALAQRIADTGGVQPAAQVLMYPMLDDRTAADTALDPLRHFLWNNRNNRGGWGWYLGQTPGQPGVPAYAVPARREDLSGLPPAWIGVGEQDLFYAEDCAYAQRLQAAGVHCVLHIGPQAPHAYDLIVPQSSVAQAFVQEHYRFLREQFRL
jgi:acetyl esterase/lipase